MCYATQGAYLCQQIWITLKTVVVWIDHTPKYESISGKVAEFAAKEASVNTIAATLGETWETVDQALGFVRTGHRPKPKPSGKRSGTRRGGPPKYNFLAAEVIECRSITWKDCCRCRLRYLDCQSCPQTDAFYPETKLGCGRLIDKKAGHSFVESPLDLAILLIVGQADSDQTRLGQFLISKIRRRVERPLVDTWLIEAAAASQFPRKHTNFCAGMEEIHTIDPLKKRLPRLARMR